MLRARHGKDMRTVIAVALVGLLTGCGGAPDESAAAARDGVAKRAAVDAARLEALASEPEQWLTVGGNYEEQHYSALSHIDTRTVHELGLAWYADLQTNLTQEATPLAIDGAIYVTEAWSKVTALDAATGELLWRYDPKVPGERASVGCCSVP